MAKKKREFKVIDGISFGDMIKKVTMSAMESEEDYKKTGRCQHNVEVSDGKWEDCENKANTDDPNHYCDRCRKVYNDLIQKLIDSQGPGDGLLILSKEIKS